MNTSSIRIIGGRHKSYRIVFKSTPALRPTTDRAKETLFSWLQVNEPGPGYIHFAATMDEEYFKQLTAEKRAIKYVRGRKSVVWVQKRDRNEALDCYNYCLVNPILSQFLCKK